MFPFSNMRGGNNADASRLMTAFNRNRPTGMAPPTGSAPPQTSAPMAGMESGTGAAPAETVGEHLAEAARLILQNPKAPDVLPSLQAFKMTLEEAFQGVQPGSMTAPEGGAGGLPALAANAPATPSARGMRA